MAEFSAFKRATAPVDEADSPESKSKPQGPKAQRDPKLDSPVTVKLIQHALYRGFSVAARFPFRSTATFDEDEFAETANDLVEFVNRIPPLRFVFNFIAPVIGLFGLQDKIERIRNTMKPRKPKEPESMFSEAEVHAS